MKMIDTQEFTVKEIYDALAQNGFQHLRGQWEAEDVTGMIYGGCVLAQTGFNLGVEVRNGFDSIADALDRFPFEQSKSKWRRLYTQDLYGNGLANVIINWNDATTKTGEYKLKTYEDVTKMAHDVLEPYFEQRVTLRKRQWNTRKVLVEA